MRPLNLSKVHDTKLKILMLLCLRVVLHELQHSMARPIEIDHNDDQAAMCG